MKITQYKLVTILAALITFSGASAQIFNEIQGAGSGITLTSGSYNVFYGDSSATFTTSGDNNAYLGFGAGKGIMNEFVTGSNNVAIGYKAGNKIRSARDNVFIGSESGAVQEVNGDNVFIGYRSGYKSTFSRQGVFLGSEAGFNTTNATYNTFIGYQSGFDNEEGGSNVFVGHHSGNNNVSGDNNVFIGRRAGYSNIAGNGNSFLGGRYFSSTVDEITAVLGSTYQVSNTGNDDVGRSNLVSANTFIGSGAGGKNDLGMANTFLGFAAGLSNGNGHGNTFVGYGAGSDNDRLSSSSGGDRNTYLGAMAGESNRQGSDNVVLGWNADLNDIGSATRNQGNVIIGSGAGLADGNRINRVVIGFQASSSTDNSVVLGNAAINSISGAVNFTATSDGRFKKEIREDVLGLEFIEKLRPVTYQYDAHNLHIRGGLTTDRLAKQLDQKSDIRYTGFIAQEVEEAALASSFDFSGVDKPQDANGIYGLRYAEFTVPAIKAIQELNEKIKKQENIIKEQSQELALYREMLLNLEARVESMERKEQSRVD